MEDCMMTDSISAKKSYPGLQTPLNATKIGSSMKVSFSMSSLRDGISPEKEMPATLPRRKEHPEKRRRPRTHNHRDEFWAAIQPNYDYLMDSYLIETCKEASGELFWEDEERVANVWWTLQEYCERHERMVSVIEHLETEVTDSDSLQNEHAKAMKALSAEMVVFDEQCQQLLRRHPDKVDEIQQRMDNLSGMWDALQHCVAPIDNQDEKTTLRKEIACQMRLLCKWIHGVEKQLGPLPRSSNWTCTDIQSKLSRHRAT